ncbi:hypothetical protein PRNP1_000282 [Phytophthora ramorum]
MGVSQSKGGGAVGVRWKLQTLVPRSWGELEQLHLRFQQEAHRRRADPVFQYFLPFPVFQTIVAPLCPDKDKLHLLAMFEALDVKTTRKLAVMDFFSGLALLVDAKKPQKLEFVLSLLDNGGLKTLNKCELTMVVTAAARGLKMFAPEADVLQESTMRPLIRRLFGDSSEVLRQTIVNKALADPEILFFMSDLESGVATSSDELLIQQGKLMRHMAYLDYQAARVKASEERGRTAAATAPMSGVGEEAKGQQALTVTLVPTAESFSRRLQSIVCPPPPNGSDQSMRVLSAVEIKKHVDPRTLQRLVNIVSDGGLSLSWKEAEALLGDMTSDQFGLVRCGDILRVMKAWVQNRRREKPEALWEFVSSYVADGVKSIEKQMNAVLVAIVKRATKALGPTVRQRTAVAKEHLLESLQSVALNPDTDDGELQWSLSIRVGETGLSVLAPTSSPPSKRLGAPLGNNIRFRLGIHPPSSADGDIGAKAKFENEGQANNDSDELKDIDSETMRLFANFLLNPEITDEEGINLASSVEKALQQELVWSSFASLWTKCSVTMHSAIRSDRGGQPVLDQYLRVCINFREDFISSVEECTGTSFAVGIRSFFLLVELEQSLVDIVEASRDMSAMLHSLGKRQNRQRAMRMIFDAFDANHSGEWSLQEFNTFQQALGKEALLEITLAELFGGSSSISFDQFVTIYENYPVAKLLEMIRQLEIGSLGNMIKGSVSITSTLNEPCVKALGVFLSPLRWADAMWKKLLLFSRSTKDLNLELQFSTLSDLLQKSSRRVGKLDCIGDPLFVASWMNCLEEFVQPPHAEHLKDRPCRSIFCSLESEINKTEQQWEFEDQSRKLPRGTSARRAEAMIPILEMAKLVKVHVKGLVLLEMRSKSIRIVCELDNLWMARPSNNNEEVDTGRS